MDKRLARIESHQKLSDICSYAVSFNKIPIISLPPKEDYTSSQSRSSSCPYDPDIPSCPPAVWRAAVSQIPRSDGRFRSGNPCGRKSLQIRYLREKNILFFNIVTAGTDRMARCLKDFQVKRRWKVRRLPSPSHPGSVYTVLCNNL